MLRRQELWEKLLSHLNHLEETEEGGAIFLQSEMGLGKTTFLKGFIQARSSSTRSSSKRPALRIETPIEPSPYGFMGVILHTLAREENKTEGTIKNLIKKMFPQKEEDFAPLLTIFGSPPQESFLPYLLPEERRGLIHTLSTNLLQRVLNHKTYLLVLEDMERADGESLSILEATLDSLRAKKIPHFLILSSSQAMTLDEKNILKKIILPPLRKDEICDYIRCKTKAPSLELDPEFQEWLFAKTRGHPFFIEHLYFYLIEKGILQGKMVGDYLKKTGLPPTLQAAIIGRLDLLEESPHQVIKGASILGGSFSAQTLQKICPSLPVDSLLEELVEKRFFKKEQDRYSFSHPLIQKVCYNTLLKSRRAILHGEVARVLEEEGAPSTALLDHYLETEKGKKKQEYLSKLAQEKKKRCLYEESAHYYHLLLEELAEGSIDWKKEKKAVIGVLLYHGEINLTIGHVAELLDFSESEEKPWMYMILSKLHEKKKAYRAAIQYAKQALNVGKLEDPEIAVRVKILLGANLKNLGQMDRAEEYLMEALEEAHPWEAIKGEALYHLGELYRLKNSCQGAISCYLQGAEIFEEEKRLPRYFECLSKLGLLYLKTEMWDEARKAFQKVMDFYKQVQNFSKLGEGCYYLGLVLKKSGRQTYGRTFFRRAIELLKKEDPYLLGMAYFHLAQIEKKRKKFYPAEKLILQAIWIFDEMANLVALEEAQNLLQEIEASREKKH